jgi:carbamoylphosphate synthase large subunit
MTGPGNIQVIRGRHDGRCYFIEGNPKFAAAMGLTIGAGLNIPLVYVKLVLGLPVLKDELVRRAGVWMVRAWQERYLEDAEIAAVPPWTEATEPAGGETGKFG